MLNRIVAASLHNRLWVFFGVLLIVIVGVQAMSQLPIDAVPDITNVQVIVNTKTGALDPGKIEKLVTYPIETEMSGIQGVEEVRSLSKYGLSQITIVFEEHMNVYFARQLVAERLQGIALPNGLSPELAPVTTGLGEVFMYIVEAKPGSALAAGPEKDQLIRLREVQDFVLRPQLKKLPGVADVDTNGGFLKQIHINFFPEKLARHGLSLERLVAKLDTLGESFGGGYIQRDGQQLIVRATGRIADLDAIANLPVHLNVTGHPVRVRDVATVSVDHALRLGASTHRGHETVIGTVLMRVGANSREVASGAEAALAAIQLPDDVEVKTVYSRGYLVGATIHTITKNLAEGAALVVIVLLLLLGNLRAAILVALAIPISMLVAIKGMQVFGVSANLMSLGAIDFGLLVDGSVVLIENVIRRMAGVRGRLSPRERLDLVLSACREVVNPLAFGLAIIMLVYVPILYLEGIEGKMFHPMALTVLMALGGSLLVAVVLMPALAYLFLTSGEVGHEEPRLFKWLSAVYGRVLAFSLAHRFVVPAVTILPAAVALVLFVRMGTDFVPQLDEQDLVINLTRDSRQDIDTSVAKQKEAEAIIAKFIEVENVFSRMGTPESALDPMSPGLADTFVILKKDRAAWPLVGGRRRTKQELFDAIQAELHAQNPEQEAAATQPIEMRFNEILEGSRADVSLRIFGPDLDKLFDYSEKAEEILKNVRGVSSIEADPLTALSRSPVLDVVLDYGKMAGFGVALKDVNESLEAAMSGREIGSFYEEDRRFPIVLHLDESLRNSIDHIARIPVGLGDGGTIPLADVTRIEKHDQVTTVARSGARRYSALSIFLKDRDLASFVTEARAKVESTLRLEPGYEAVWGGQFTNLERARGRLLVIIPVTLLLIFVLLLRGLGSLGQAALVFSAIPFAMVGGVFALWLRDISMSVSASIGFIALAGIAVLNSMVMVTFFHQLESEGTADPVMRGALARLRPVLTTALVASLGFVPMALNTGAGAEVQRPLATVVIGGILTSTILTLIVIPVSYRWLRGRVK